MTNIQQEIAELKKRLAELEARTGEWSHFLEDGPKVLILRHDGEVIETWGCEPQREEAQNDD